MRYSRLLLSILLCFTASFVLAAQSFNVVTVAGTDSLRDGSPATTALLRSPRGVAIDASGNIYIADSDGNRIRKVGQNGVISTVAGNGLAGYKGDGALARNATLDEPHAVAVDKDGNLYIADYNNNRIRKVNAATGVINTIAGNGNYRASGDGGPAASAAFDPAGIAIDAAGNVYIADYINDRVRKVAASTGIITTIAGTGVTGYSGDSGPASQALLNGPSALSFDTAGNLYICDQWNHVIRKVGTDGIITTIAGTGAYGDGGDTGPARQATLFLPDTIAVDSTRSKLYISTFDRIRVVDLASGTINRFAGTGDIGYAGDGGGSADRAMFYLVLGLSVAPDGDVLAADAGNHRVRRISNGTVDVIAGSDVRDGVSATQAYLSKPEGVAITRNGDMYISDTQNSRIRKVAAADGRITTIAGTGLAGYNSGRIQSPSGITIDPNGNIVFADYGNNRIQRVSPQGVMTTIVGSSRADSGFSGDGGFAAGAMLSGPADVAYDAAGNLYIADLENLRVRKVDAATGLISTIAGTGALGLTGLNGPATQAPMAPIALAVDPAANLFVADAQNRVLKIAASSGIVTLAAGTGAPGFSGDGKPATSAQLTAPMGIALDAAGNLYIADSGNFAVRRVNSAGVIQTIAGSGDAFLTSEQGPALLDGMMPASVTVGATGEIYFADSLNDRIRKLTPAVARTVSVSSGNNQTGDSGAKLTIAVRATDEAGYGVSGVAVVFAVTSGSATLSSASAVTAGDGIARTVVTLGSQAGPVVITASASGFPTMTFNLTVKPAAVVPSVTINSSGVVGASLTPGKRTLSTGGIASIFGQNLAAAGTARKVETTDLVNGRVPLALADVCVEVGRVRAPVFAVYPTQVNFQVPEVAAGDNVPVQVITGCGSAAELRSNTEMVRIQANAPEFFFFRPSTTGRAAVAAINAITGAYLGGSELGAGFVPARPKDVITVFGTSFGATDRAVAPGEFASGIASVTAPVKVTLGGRDVPASGVLYAGVTPNSPGLYQLNLIIPEDTPDGDIELKLTIGSAETIQGGYVTVKKE